MSRDPFGLTGTLIDGQFRVERVIGEGGFSVVYRGMHVGLSEPIAVKCLKLTTSLDGESIESFTRRFRDEGRLLYRLGQGNLDIVRCIMGGTTVSPLSGALVPYMVLEWLEGKSLAVDLKARRQQQLRGRSLEELVALFDPGVAALEYAHQQGVVHRDVKPANLFLVDHPGRVRMKVLDFGLAKVLDATVGITLAATAGNFMMCSPRYAAPEQFDPKIGAIGPWTDVYSMALVLLEALRDQKVRKGEGLIGCVSEALDPKTDMSAKALGMHLPSRIEAALARAVSLDIAARQKSAGELWSEIKTAMRERAVSPWSSPPPRLDPLEVTEDMEPSTMSPASFADKTIVDQVFSVPAPDFGETLMMIEPPSLPMPAPPAAAKPSSAPAPLSPQGQSLASYLRAGLAPAPPQSMPEQTTTVPPAAPRRSRAARVLLLLFLVLVALGAAGFFGWRRWTTYAITHRSSTP